MFQQFVIAAALWLWINLGYSGFHAMAAPTEKCGALCGVKLPSNHGAAATRKLPKQQQAKKAAAAAAYQSVSSRRRRDRRSRAKKISQLKDDQRMQNVDAGLEKLKFILSFDDDIFLGGQVYMEHIVVDAFRAIGYDLKWNCELNITGPVFDHFDIDHDGAWNSSEMRYLTQTTHDDALIQRLAGRDGLLERHAAVQAQPIATNCKPVWYGGRHDSHTQQTIVQLSSPETNHAWFEAEAKSKSLAEGLRNPYPDLRVQLRSPKPGQRASVHVATRILDLYFSSYSPEFRSLLLYCLEARLITMPDGRTEIVTALERVYMDFELIATLLRLSPDVSAGFKTKAEEQSQIGLSVLTLLAQHYSRNIAVTLVEVKAYSVMRITGGCDSSQQMVVARKPVDGRPHSCGYDSMQLGDPFMDAFGDQSNTPTMENDSISGAFKFFASVMRVRFQKDIQETGTTRLGGRNGDFYITMYKTLHAQSASFRKAEDRWNGYMREIMSLGDIRLFKMPSLDDRSVPQSLAMAIDDEYSAALFDAFMEAEFPLALVEIAYVIPPQGWTLLHHAAIQNKPQLVRRITSRFQALFSPIGPAEGKERFLDALVQALSRPDMLLGRIPSHFAARLAGGDSDVYKALCELEDWAVQVAHRFAQESPRLPAAPRRAVRDEFGMLATDYAKCTTLTRACPGPLQWPSFQMRLSAARNDPTQRWDVHATRRVTNSRSKAINSPTLQATMTPDGQVELLPSQKQLFTERAQQRRIEGDWFASGRREDLLRCSAPASKRSEMCPEWHPESGHVRTDVQEFYGLPTPAQFASFMDELRPVVFRGAANELFNQTAYAQFSRRNFLARFGDRPTPVGDLPYLNSYFEDGGVVETTVAGFISSFSNNTESRPLYMLSSDFPKLHNDFRSLCEPLFGYLTHVNEASGGLVSIPKPIDPSIHCGGPGSGAPVHYHNYALNVQFYGSKRWIFYPVGAGFRSKVTAKEWLFEKIPDLQQHEDGDLGTPVELLTQAGDVLLVPKSWSHGTLMIEGGVAIAQEIDYAPVNSNELGSFGT